MKKTHLVLISLILFTLFVSGYFCKEVPSKKIKKIILVCMENHSYDNLVIILKK
jgi:phospholipase C